MTDEQLVPKLPRRKKQPTAEKLRETISALVDNNIRLAAENETLDLENTALRQRIRAAEARWWHHLLPRMSETWPLNPKAGEPPYRNPSRPPHFDGRNGSGYQPLPESPHASQPPGAE